MGGIGTVSKEALHNMVHILLDEMAQEKQMERQCPYCMERFEVLRER